MKTFDLTLAVAFIAFCLPVRGDNIDDILEDTKANLAEVQSNLDETSKSLKEIQRLAAERRANHAKWRKDVKEGLDAIKEINARLRGDVEWWKKTIRDLKEINRKLQQINPEYQPDGIRTPPAKAWWT